MEKIEFKNYEDSPTTPINAQSLKLMQDNIEEAIDNINFDSETLDISGTNLNDYTENLLFAFGSSCINRPSVSYESAGGFLSVLREEDSERCVQTWTDIKEGGISDWWFLGLTFQRTGTKVSNGYIWSDWQQITGDFKALETKVNKKADKTYVDTELVGKANISDVNTELEKKINKKFLPRAVTTNLDFDKTEDEWGSIRHDIVTNNVATGKPVGDGFVTTFFWDNSGNFDSQLYIPNSETSPRVPQWRSRGNGTWGEWINLYPETIIDGDRQAIKFPDGTLICSARYFATNTPVDIALSGNVAYKSAGIALPNFLVEFVGIPSITYGVQQNITANRLIGVYPQAMDMSTFRPPYVFIGAHGGTLPGYGAANCPIISYQAIGRWK